MFRDFLHFTILVISLLLTAYFGYTSDSCNPAPSIEPPVHDRNVTFTERFLPKLLESNEAINLVFFGLDKTQERKQNLGSFRTDTIILMHVDPINKQLSMLSIPRDTLVYIQSIKRMDKINHAFSYGGGETGNGFADAVAALERLLDIKIDHYLGMDMQVISPMVDSVGGISMEVDLEYHEGDCHLNKGSTQVLNGVMAYHYVHFRYTENGDIDRIAHQQRFLKAFLSQVPKRLSLEQSLQVYEQFRPMTYTDMSLAQLISLGYYIRHLDSSQITTCILAGSFLNQNGISYWQPDLENTPALQAKDYLTD